MQTDADFRRPASAAAHIEASGSKRGTRQQDSRKNLGSGSRTACFAAGAGLMAYGAKRRGVAGTLVGLFGAELIYHGLAGRSALLRWAGVDTLHPPVVTAERTVTVGRSCEEIYQFWKDPANMPWIMEEIESVIPLDETHWHWKAKPIAGMQLEWDTEIMQDIPGRLLSWRSTEGAPLSQAGTLIFTPAPANRGAEVKLRFQYKPPAGEIGNAIAGLFGRDAYHTISRQLRNLEQVMETGEVARTNNQPAGARSLAGKLVLSS
ncbi:MAG TPA: SRPBCC family protein [Bryobacteraceae bacterium]|nr:SRPBCC family protein [Bryobacteraceae bacterium]